LIQVSLDCRTFGECLFKQACEAHGLGMDCFVRQKLQHWQIVMDEFNRFDRLKFEVTPGVYSFLD
jgi:hypothetical protein